MATKKKPHIQAAVDTLDYDAMMAEFRQPAAEEAQLPTMLDRFKRGMGATANAAAIGTSGRDDVAGLVASDAREQLPASPAAQAMQQEAKPYVDAANSAEGLSTVGAYATLAAKRIGQFITNPREFAGMIAENLPNAAPGMAGTIAGGMAGGAVAGPIGGLAGSVVGGTAGGYLIEQGAAMREQILKEAQARGVDARDPAALAPIIAEKYDEFLTAARMKGIGTAGTDAILNRLTLGIAGMGEKAIVKGAGTAGAALKAGTVTAEQAGATMAELAAKQSARTTLGRGLARGAGVTGMEMGGEGFSEAAGQALAYGKVDAGDVVDESLLGLGQGAAMAATRGMYAKATGAATNSDADAAIGRLGAAIRATMVPEGGPMTRAANAAIEAQAKAADAGLPPLQFTATELPTGKGDSLALADKPDTTALDFEADPRFAGAMPFDNGAAPAQPVFSSKTLADIHIGEQGAMGELEAVDAGGGQWTVKQTDQAANKLARANIEQWMAKAQPMPEERARAMVKDAEAQLNKKMTALPMPDGSGWTVVPTQWVSAPILMDYVEHAAAAEQANAEREARAKEAGESAVVRAPRTPSANAVEIDPKAPNAVAQFIAAQAATNTMSARAFVQDYRAGRITDADVLERINPKKASEPSADERIAAAAAQAPKLAPTDGLILNPNGEPFKTELAANRAQKKAGTGAVLQVAGGWVVRPGATTVEPSNAQDQATRVPPAAAPAPIQEGADSAGPGTPAAPAAGAAGPTGAAAPAVEGAGVAPTKPVMLGKLPDKSGFGASIGGLSTGDRRQLMVDPAGGYFWGDWNEASARDGSKPVVGKHASFTPAKFDSGKEGREAAAATPQSKSEPSGQAASQPPKPESAIDRRNRLKAERATAAAPAPAAPAVVPGTTSGAVEADGVKQPDRVKVMTRQGQNVYVERADLESDKPRMRHFTSTGKSLGLIVRENLDPTGELRRADAKEAAENPLFDAIGTKDGRVFASEAAAARELSQRGLKDTHEVAPEGNGFIVKRRAPEAAPQPTSGESAPAPSPAAAPAAPSANTLVTEDAAEKARAIIRAKLRGNTLNSGIDPELLQAGITLAAYHVERGARKFAAYARAMVDDLGDVVKPYLQSWYMAMRSDPTYAAMRADMDKASAVEDLDVDEVLAGGAPAAPNAPAPVEAPSKSVAEAPDVSAPAEPGVSTAEQVATAQELLAGVQDGEHVSEEDRKAAEQALGIYSLNALADHELRRMLSVLEVNKANTTKVLAMSPRPRSINDIADALGALAGAAAKRAEYERAFKRAADLAPTNEAVANALNVYTVQKLQLESIASERGMYGVKWAERNIGQRWTTQSIKVRKAKDRVVEAVRAAPTLTPKAQAVKEALAGRKEREQADQRAADEAAKYKQFDAKELSKKPTPASMTGWFTANYEGKKVWTQGTILDLSGEPPHLAGYEDRMSPDRNKDGKIDVSRVIPRNKGPEAVPFGYYDGEYGKAKGLVYLEADGRLVGADATLFRYFASKFKGAVYFSSPDGGVITVQQGGKTVGVLMPIKLGTDAQPAPSLADMREKIGAKPAAPAAKPADTYPNTAAGAIEAFNDDNPAQAMVIAGRLKIDALQELGTAVGFVPYVRENATNFRARLAEAAPYLGKTKREEAKRQKALYDKLIDRAMAYDRSADHMANSLRLGNAVDSQANMTGYKPMEADRDNGGWTPIPEALDKYAADVDSLRSDPDFEKVAAMVRDKRPRVFDHKPTAPAAKAPAAEPNKFADYDAEARQYGYEVRPDGSIGSDGKFPGVKMVLKGGRLRVESGAGNLLGSYAPTPASLGKFLEGFWYAEKKAAPTPAAQPESEPAKPTPDLQTAPMKYREAAAEAKRLTAETGKPHEAANRERVDEDGYTVSEWFAEPAKVAPAGKPAPGRYAQPVKERGASRDGQMEMAHRASRIASLSALNEMVRQREPEAAYTDDEIQGAANIDAMQDWLSERGRAAPEAAPAPREEVAAVEPAPAEEAKPEVVEPVATGTAPMPAVGGISMSLAQQAHAGTSHVPERRAEQERASFNGALQDAWDRAARIAGTDPAAIERITEVFTDVADGYRARYTAALQARSRIMSTMIAGGGNFPVARMEKRNATERKRAEEASEYLARGIKRLIRAARGPIDNSPESELERVRLNLTQREEAQEQMVAANAALRKGDDAALEDLGFTAEQIADLKKGSKWDRGFPSYRLSNNNAEIRRLRERLKSAEERMQDAAAGPVETERAGVKIVEDATDDRLRLIFDGKPSEEVREDLKANGFKWSPKNEAWQRQLTDNARRAAKQVLDKHYPQTRADDAGNVALFSRAQGQQPASDRRQAVEALVQQIAARWANAPEVVVVDSMDDPRVPEAVRRDEKTQQSKATAGAPEGFFHGGKVYLVAPQLGGDADVIRVLFHEALGHFGLRGTFGPALGTILDRVAILQAAKVRAKAKQYGLDYDKASDRRAAAEEVLSDMAQRTPELGWGKKAVAAVRTWLRQHVPGFRQMALSDDEIVRSYILPARAFVQRGGAAGGQGGGVQFSRADAKTDTPAFRRWFGASKVVDAQGKPLVVYHGSGENITEFEPGRRDPGVWFTSRRETASGYAKGDEPTVHDVYLSATKPLVVDSTTFDSGSVEVDGRTFEDNVAIVKYAERAGYDSVHFPGGNFTEDDNTWVVFRPDQIKSATGNSGAFDPANADIRYSRASIADAVRDFSQAGARNAFLDAVTTHGSTNLWTRTVGTQYHKAQANPTTFGRVFDAVQDYIKDTSVFANQAADLAPSLLPKMETWRDVAKGGLLRHGADRADTAKAGEAIFQGTLDKVLYDDATLASRFGLNALQVGLYHEFRAAADESLTGMAKSEILRLAGDAGRPVRNAVLAAGSAREAADIMAEHLADVAEQSGDDDLLGTAASIGEKVTRIEQLQGEGYAPLMRFGKHTLHITRADGGTEFFGMYETVRDANIAARQLRGDPVLASLNFKQGVMSQEGHKLFAGLSLDSLELFADATGNANNPVYQAYLKLATNNRSAMRRMIERKNIAGYSDDVARVLASFVTSNARMASGNLHLTEAKKAAEAIPKEQGDLRDDAINLVEYVTNPAEEAAAVRGLLFTTFIGGSVASALVNLTQPITMTYPYLVQFGGAAKALKRMTAALAMVATGKGMDADLAAALARAEDDGIVSPQEIHHLQGAAMGKLTDWPILKKAAFIWGSMFSLAEQFNRRVSFVAAYQTAQQEGIANPFKFAEQAVVETQGLYNKGNKANLARGAVGATVMTFKQFSTHYLEFLTRMWKSGPEGKKAVGIALALLMLTAGAGGLPFADDLDDLIDTLGQAMGHDTNMKRWKREAIAGAFSFAGPEFAAAAAEVGTRGLSALPGMPMDLSIRMGLGNPLPATGLFLRSNTDTGRQLLEIAGAAGGLAANVMDGVKKAASGDVVGGVMNAMPVAVQNMAKAAQMWDTGEYRNKKGQKVMNVDAVDGAMKFIGFQPAAVARESSRIGETMRTVQLAKNVEGEIAGRWAQGMADGDREAVASARQELADWNKANPQAPIRITMPQVLARLKALKSTRAERTTKAAPKELRPLVGEALN